MDQNEEAVPAIQENSCPNGEIPKQKTSTWQWMKERQRQIIQTIVLYLGFFALGLEFSVVGPTLLDLGRITNSDTQSVSMVFLSRSVAGLGGAILAGATIPRVNHWLLLALTNLMMGILNIFFPYITMLPLLCALFALSGVCGAFYDAGGNMTLLKVWGKENGPWMQALHCIFGSGALIGPLVAEPFLKARATEGSKGPSTTLPFMDNSSSVVTQDPSGNLKIFSNSSQETHPGSLDVGAYLNNQTQNMTLTTQPYQTDIVWAYLIIGIICIVAGLLLMCVFFCCSEIKLSCRNKLKEKPKEIKKEGGGKKEKRKLTIVLIALLFAFYLTYCILEMNVGNYLSAYAVKGLGWSEKDGAKVTAGYWATFTGGRALGILIVSYVSPTKIIMGDLTISVLSLGTLMFLANAHTVVLWVCMLVLGLGISTVFATGITWAEIYINVSGGVGAIFMIAGAGGEMVGPLLIGALFEKLGAYAFVYVMFSAACLLVILFGVMVFVSRKLGKRKMEQDESVNADEENLQREAGNDEATTNL